MFSYSLPLISIVSGKLEVMIITSGLLMFFAIAYIRMGMPYANPTLYILGYKIYDVTIKESGKSIIVLTKQVNIKTNTIYILNKLDNYNYYLKEQGGRAISDV